METHNRSRCKIFLVKVSMAYKLAISSRIDICWFWQNGFDRRIWVFKRNLTETKFFWKHQNHEHVGESSIPTNRLGCPSLQYPYIVLTVFIIAVQSIIPNRHFIISTFEHIQYDYVHTFGPQVKVPSQNFRPFVSLLGLTIVVLKSGPVEWVLFIKSSWSNSLSMFS